MRKFRKPIFTILFILINVAVILITGFSEFGNSENAAKLSEVKINYGFLIPAAVCFIIAIKIEISKYVLMMRRAGKIENKTKKRKIWKTARRTVLWWTTIPNLLYA